MFTSNGLVRNVKIHSFNRRLVPAGWLFVAQTFQSVVLAAPSGELAEAGVVEGSVHVVELPRPVPRGHRPVQQLAPKSRTQFIEMRVGASHLAVDAPMEAVTLTALRGV